MGAYTGGLKITGGGGVCSFTKTSSPSFKKVDINMVSFCNGLALTSSNLVNTQLSKIIPRWEHSIA